MVSPVPNPVPNRKMAQERLEKHQLNQHVIAGIGGDERDRTVDLCVANLSSHTSLTFPNHQNNIAITDTLV